MSGIKINVGQSEVTFHPGEKVKTLEDVKQISAKLHPVYDRQLREIMAQIPKRERSKFYRDAVNHYLKHLGMR